MSAGGIEAFKLFGVIEVNREAVIAAFREIEGKATALGASMSSSFQRAEKAIKLHRDEIQKIGVGFAAAGAVILGTIGMMAKAAIEDQRASERLAATLKATGAAADPSRLIALADSLQEVTRFSDESTKSMMAMLAGMKFSEAQITRLTPVVQNLAVMFGKDLDTAGRLVGVTLTKFTNTMTRMGVVIPPAILASKDFNLILGYLEARSAGVAARMGQGADSIVIMQNQIGELTEDIGFLLLPKLTEWMNKLRGVIGEIRSFVKEHPNFSRTVGDAALNFGLMATGIGAVALALPRVIALFSGPAGWTLAIAAVTAAALAGIGALDSYYKKLKQAPPVEPTWIERGVLAAGNVIHQPAAVRGDWDQYLKAAGTPPAWKSVPSFDIKPMAQAAGAAAKYTKSIEDVTTALDKMERRYASHLTTQTQLTAGVDRLIAENGKWLRGTEAGLDELGKLYARSKALHQEMADAAKKIADDEKRTAEERLAARKKEIDQVLAGIQAEVQQAEIAGKPLAPDVIKAKWKAVLVEYAAYLDTTGGKTAKFTDIARQVNDNILGIIREGNQERARLAKEWLDEAYQMGLDEASAAEEVAKRKIEIDRSYNEARQKFLLETGQMTRRQYEEVLAGQEKALTRVIELYRLAGGALENLQALEIALMQLQTERHRNNEQIAADNEKAISQQDQIRVYLDRMAEEMSKPQKVVLHGWAATMKDITEIAKQAGEEIQRAFANAVYGMMKHMGSLREFLINVWDIILSVIANVIAKIVAKWIDGIAKMKKAQGGAGGGGGFDWVGTAISVGLGFLGLQHGGLVTRPTMAMIGEAGPEAVIPLSKLTSRSPLELGLGAPGAIAAQGTTIGEFHYHQTNNLTPDALDPVGVQRLSDRLMNSLGRSLERGLRLTPVGAR